MPFLHILAAHAVAFAVAEALAIVFVVGLCCLARRIHEPDDAGRAGE